MKKLIELLNIDEENGGDYVINTPYAFTPDSDDDDLIKEVSYSDFKNDESSTFKQKINNSITEVNKQLYKLEQSVKQSIRLKTEMNVENKVFYKSTVNKFNKIQERLNRLSHNIRELSK